MCDQLEIKRCPKRLRKGTEIFNREDTFTKFKMVQLVCEFAFLYISVGFTFLIETYLFELRADRTDVGVPVLKSA